jgi:putative oxidoreductase
MKQQLDAIARRIEPAAWLALRIVAGAMFAMHGVQKIVGWPGGANPITVGSQIWIGGIIELVGGVLIAIGLWARPAAFIASGTMAVAYIQYHWKLDFAGHKWLPSVNKGELAAIYCFLFLFIAVRGRRANS